MNEAISHPWALWIIATLVFGILEILLPSFYFIFASIASLVTALIALQFNWAAQMGGFSLTLLLSIALIRPRFVKKLHTSKDIPSRAGILVGKTGKVTESIDPVTGSGRVMVHGEDWAAKSTHSIAEGKTITVEGADGIILKVKEI